MEPFELPQAVMDKVRTFMLRMGLRYGCLDMIVKPNGGYVFLEVNPNGQWYFVQLRTGIKIAEAIAQELL
jgi:glutathione synthase/RimK-type ligase-like ATP-grasp enzyme